MAKRTWAILVAPLLGVLAVLSVEKTYTFLLSDECKARGYDFKDGAACIYDSRVRLMGEPGHTRYIIGIDWARAHNTESWAYIYGQEDGLRKGIKMETGLIIDDKRSLH